MVTLIALVAAYTFQANSGTYESLCSIRDFKVEYYHSKYSGSRHHTYRFFGRIEDQKQMKCAQQIFTPLKKALFPGGSDFTKENHIVKIELETSGGGVIQSYQEMAKSFKSLCTAENNCALKTDVTGTCGSACLTLFLAANRESRKISAEGGELCFHTAKFEKPVPLLGLRVTTYPRYFDKILDHKDFDSKKDDCRRMLKGAIREEKLYCFTASQLKQAKCDFFDTKAIPSLSGKPLKDFLLQKKYPLQNKERNRFFNNPQ